ncbi:MAG: hypothetical protein AAF916_06945 [Planctomycetota bacterium]
MPSVLAVAILLETIAFFMVTVDLYGGAIKKLELRVHAWRTDYAKSRSLRTKGKALSELEEEAQLLLPRGCKVMINIFLMLTAIGLTVVAFDPRFVPLLIAIGIVVALACAFVYLTHSGLVTTFAVAGLLMLLLDRTLVAMLPWVERRGARPTLILAGALLFAASKTMMIVDAWG